MRIFMLGSQETSGISRAMFSYFRGTNRNYMN
jgi:hypothetical protein